jgi:formylglycine-generating enzyme required for sulfatase activity
MKKRLTTISLFILISLVLSACESVVSSTPDTGSIIISDKDGAKMVHVPQGEFTMGIAENPNLLYPAHKVILDPFWIDQTEVTNAMYAKCVAAGVCEEPDNKSSSTQSSYYGNSEFDDYPVIYVDWNMANGYCEWRGDKLPTEAQWEKAARGTDGRIYPWGNDIDCSLANYYWTSLDYSLWENNHYCTGDTTKVGSYESGKSPYGVYDMVGNVSEWVADWAGAAYELNSVLYNPLGPDDGVYRMTRGGSWNDSVPHPPLTYFTLSLSSSTLSTFYVRDDIGFRCARDE